MEKNTVFIATSIDGFIADENGSIDWLETVPNPDQIDMGYGQLIKSIDALIMGRNTFETVCEFDIEWPYTKPVFVLSNTMSRIPEEYKGKIELVSGTLKDVLKEIHHKGYNKLYIDGGNTIQNFLREDLIDEMIITVIPVLLGSGIPLFNNLTQRLRFDAVATNRYLDSIVQVQYVRKS